MDLRKQYAKRLDHLFAEASRHASGDADQVRAQAAAAGKLRSGATIRRIIEAIEARSLDAVREALASLDRRPMRARTRQDLRGQLKTRIADHLRGDVRSLPGRGPNPGAAQAIEVLFDEAEGRLLAAVDQHATGFAPASRVSWVAAHPTAAFVITTGIALAAMAVSLIALFGVE